MSADYQRGYQRGQASMRGSIDEHRRAAEEANERARRAEAGIVGHCQQCARWARNEGCRWGYCNPPKSITLANENWWGEPGQKVCTQENFGCVRFIQQTPGA